MIPTGENRSTGRRAFPNITLSTTMSHGLSWDWDRVSAVRGRRLTAWTMAWYSYNFVLLFRRNIFRDLSVLLSSSEQFLVRCDRKLSKTFLFETPHLSSVRMKIIREPLNNCLKEIWYWRQRGLIMPRWTKIVTRIRDMTCTRSCSYSFMYSWWWVRWHPKHVE